MHHRLSSRSILAVLLVGLIVLLAGSLVACGEEATDTTAAPGTTEGPAATQSPTTAAGPGTTAAEPAATTLGDPQELTVSAASSLKAAFTEVGAAFDKARNAKTTFNFDASGTLQKQIESGAPVDVFAAAAMKQVKALVEGKFIDQAAVRVFASNEIVVALPADSTLGVASFEDLTKADVKKVAYGDPAAAPHGLYAEEAMTTLGIFDQGLAFHSLSQSAADVSLIETRKATREEAAATYGIPAPMIGILDHATYSNISELRRSFYVDTVAPYCTLIEDTEEAQLIDPVATWVREGVFTEFDLGEILKPDPLAEAQSIMLLTSSGTTSTNDNRKFKRLDPVGNPADPANPFNRPRVPANLVDPQAPAAETSTTSAAAAIHDGLVLEAMRAGRTAEKEEDDEAQVPAR